MGPDLKLKTRMPRTASPVEKVVSADTPKAQKISTGVAVPTTASGFKTPPVKDPLSNISAPDAIKKPGGIKTPDSEIVRTFKPAFTFEKKELLPDEQFIHTLNNTNMYIWKTHDGIIGFSNIQYPDDKTLTLYRDKVWVKYKYTQNANELK